MTVQSYLPIKYSGLLKSTVDSVGLVSSFFWEGRQPPAVSFLPWANRITCGLFLLPQNGAANAANDLIQKQKCVTPPGSRGRNRASYYYFYQ